MKKPIVILTFAIISLGLSSKEPKVAPSYSWTITPELGERVKSDIDTFVFDYGQRAVPAAQSIAYATTGNYGAEGETLIFSHRDKTSDFFFRDAVAHWLPSIEKVKFYNTRVPMTLLSYNFGGSKQTGQDNLKADFSGNINSRAQVGAMVDYLHSKGSYANQAAKHLTWGFSGSYMGERYQFQGFYYHYNALNLENGGITNDLYITDPAEIQGGITSVDTKNIPTRLTTASSRVVGGQLLLNNRYNLGFHRDVDNADADTVVTEFVPVTSVIWTLDYRQARHNFNNSNSTQGHEFWENYYLNASETRDHTSYWSLRNTVGVSLLEGFNKYAKASLSAFVTHEYRHFTQMIDSLDRTSILPDGLQSLPSGAVPSSKAQNLAWVGAQLARRQGRILNYDAIARIGFAGEAVGEVIVDGKIDTNIPFVSDSIKLEAYGHFSNTTVPYLLRHYISNHFSWNNEFGKIRDVKFGGKLTFAPTSTTIDVSVENVQNHVFFNEFALPEQSGSNVQVFTAMLEQKLRWRAINWDNTLVYQKSSDAQVIPLPEFAFLSNLYFYFRIAKVLQVQLGVDCRYYTRYNAVAYQPATMTFYNQEEVKCGNYPVMNLYVNMKLKRARFYLMMSHVNQGWFGSDYFSMPHYPINPRRFQLGVSIDFLN